MQLIYPDKDSGFEAWQIPCRPRYLRALKKFKCLPVKAKAGHMPQVWPSDFKDFQTYHRHRVGQDTSAGGRRWIRLTRRGAIAAAAAEAAAAKSKVFNIGGISPPLATTKPIWQYFKTLK